MIIIRTLFDIDDNDTRTYHIRELANEERHFLEIVSSSEVRISRATNNDHTALTYSIL